MAYSPPGRRRRLPGARAVRSRAAYDLAAGREYLRRAEPDAPEFADYRWPERARPEQLTPALPWWLWVIMAGRGWGKNRTGAETVRQWVREMPGSRGALVARTAADVRDTMLDNPGSGLLNIFPPSERPLYEPSKRRLTWPNGTWATLYSGDKPDQMRGPQHHWAWGDEFSTWRYGQDALDNLLLGLRLGEMPRAVLTMTPRNTAAVKRLLNPPAELEELGRTIVTRGTTMENADNLAPMIVAQLLARYKGTRLERQELYGELVDDIEGAYWIREDIEEARVTEWTGKAGQGRVCYGDHDDPLEAVECGSPVHIERVVVAVDPGGSGADNDPTGIAVVGLGDDGEWYVLEAVALRVSPEGWASAAVHYFDLYRANTVVAEKNHGGEMVLSTLRNARPSLPVKTIHAKKGKALRAEPVSLLYEQHRVHHLGYLGDLEEQMVNFTPWTIDGGDPTGGHFDLVDAAVYAILELSEGTLAAGAMYPVG